MLSQHKTKNETILAIFESTLYEYILNKHLCLLSSFQKTKVAEIQAQKSALSFVFGIGYLFNIIIAQVLFLFNILVAL